MFKRVLAFVSLLALVAVSCGGAAATPTPTATRAAAPAPTLAPTAAAAPAAQPTPTATRAPAPTPTAAAAALAAVQVYRVNLAGEPETIDPNKAHFASEISVAKQLFDGMFSFNQDLTVRPVLAEAIPTVANGGISADGLTYTIKLRPGVKWSDGKDVTAEDIVYSVKRMLDPATAGQYTTFYYSLKGAEELNKEKDAGKVPALKDALGVRALDARTVQFTLRQPDPIFLNLLALWPVYPIRRDVVERYGDKWTEAGNLIGNGPFLLKEWAHQDHITLERSPNYWGRPAKLQRIVVKMVTDVNAELAAYKNNELDVSRVPPGTEKATLDDPVLGKEIVRFPELVTFAFQFNNTVPPFDNKPLRQAITTAIDRDSFINKVRNGVGRPATSWIPPGMPGFDPDLGSQYKLNPARAKELLAQAGFPEGRGLPPLKFQYADTAGNKVIAEFLQANMKDHLGINIVLEPTEPRAFSALITQKKHTWALLGWGADYPDPDNWLPELFGSGKPANRTNYTSPAFDDLVKRAKAELDEKKRLDLWKQAHKVLIDDAPLAPIFYRERFFLRKPWVQDMRTTGMDGQLSGDFFLAELYIAQH
ncbi:MAG: peptide ABC transporter substrate-binding protein [Chloroflexi bacterium]|nr:peptide ABC transporter substrate-binding protein [Chloroflexota bacterium]